tara:strand:+ start:256 stop:594 length:339 start_codon:yes stop_codon:yes gene_type:complete
LGLTVAGLVNVLARKGGSINLAALRALLKDSESLKHLDDVGLTVFDLLPVLACDSGSSGLNALLAFLKDKTAIERMAQLGSYEGEPELYALAHSLERAIIVIIKGDTGAPWI